MHSNMQQRKRSLRSEQRRTYLDEYLYWLWPHEIRTHIPVIEKLMLDGMRTVISDVAVGVESSCMLHWDKKAKVFSEIEFDSKGLPILEEPPFVKQLLTEQQKGA